MNQFAAAMEKLTATAVKQNQQVLYPIPMELVSHRYGFCILAYEFAFRSVCPETTMSLIGF